MLIAGVLVAGVVVTDRRSKGEAAEAGESSLAEEVEAEADEPAPESPGESDEPAERSD